jgi:hypothetical protein
MITLFDITARATDNNKSISILFTWIVSGTKVISPRKVLHIIIIISLVTSEFVIWIDCAVEKLGISVSLRVHNDLYNVFKQKYRLTDIVFYMYLFRLYVVTAFVLIYHRCIKKIWFLYIYLYHFFRECDPYTDILLKMELNSHFLIKIRFRCISSLFSLVLTLTFNNIQFGFMAGNLSFNFDRTIIYKIV